MFTHFNSLFSAAFADHISGFFQSLQKMPLFLHQGKTGFCSNNVLCGAELGGPGSCGAFLSGQTGDAHQLTCVPEFYNGAMQNAY